MRVFKTKRLHLAAYLHAAGVLRFSHAESDVHGRTIFVFEDPERIGAEAELAYDNGAPVAAVSFSSSLTYVRKQIDSVETGAKYSNESHTRR